MRSGLPVGAGVEGSHGGAFSRFAAATHAERQLRNSRHVSYWHLADSVTAAVNVGFRSKSRRGADTLRCRLLTQRRHLRAGSHRRSAYCLPVAP